MALWCVIIEQGRGAHLEEPETTSVVCSSAEIGRAAISVWNYGRRPPNPASA